jgi:inosine-uridine nucleoside N-ribohydrolase
MFLPLVKILRITLCAGALASQVSPALAQLSASDPQKVILDTDFVMPPQDDSMALMLVLKSPELKLLGVTTVAGNDTMQRATNDALRELEIAGRTDVAVYRGANQPLVHENTDWSRTWGHWLCCRDTTVLPDAQTTPPPPGGFAKRHAEKESAVDFIIRSVNANPGQVTIIAIGPLTNIATAIRQEPGLAKKIKKISIMGGVIWSLPLGPEGNERQNTEFNFWVDPEAAHVVLRSGIPIALTPLNVTAKTHLTKYWFEKITAANTPLTNLMKDTMARRYTPSTPDSGHPMHDQLAVASLIDPTLVKSVDIYVDVDINHGPDYGTAVGWSRTEDNDATDDIVSSPAANGAKKITVQYDVDNERFMKMFYERVTAK